MPPIAVILIITVVVVIVAAIVTYYVLRFMRGSIKLTLLRTAFNPGETISGSFDLQTKKTIEGKKLVVRLIGTKKTTTGHGDNKKTRTEEIYRDEVVLEGEKQYPAGHAATHEFEINTPNTGSSDFMNSALGQALTGAMRLLSDRRTRLKWKVEARLDAKGIDLAASKTISINMPR